MLALGGSSDGLERTDFFYNFHFERMSLFLKVLFFKFFPLGYVVVLQILILGSFHFGMLWVVMKGLILVSFHFGGV